MLYTERHHQILRYLETHSSVTVQELSKIYLFTTHLFCLLYFTNSPSFLRAE